MTYLITWAAFTSLTISQVGIFHSNFVHLLIDIHTMSLLRSVIPLSILVLLHAPKAFGEQAKTVVVDKWYDGFKGLITLDLTDDVTSGWTLTLSFPVPTPNLEIWRAEIVDNQGDKVYIMKNMPWNTQMSEPSSCISSPKSLT